MYENEDLLALEWQAFNYALAELLAARNDERK
jgi:hypothetical protein